MIFNLWMGFDDLAQSGGAEDSETFRHLGDPRVRQIYREDTDTSAPRIYTLWNLYYENVNTDQEAVDIRNDINAEFPGQVRTIGGWWFDGRQVGTEFTFTEVANPGYNADVEPVLIPNPNHQPDPFQPGYDPRAEIPNPIYDPDLTIIEVGVTGTPLFPLHTSILEYIPDVDDIGTRPTDPSDVNLAAGQTPRRFS
jgi:hypothetical protein